MHMIEIRNIQYHYPGGEFTLQVPELDIATGSTVAIIGPSGTGKTTLLNLMAGYFVPQQGMVWVNGEKLSAMQDKKQRDFRIRNIGLVFQEFELMEYLNVLDNILLPFRITPSLKLDRTVRNRAVELAHEVGIEDKLQRNVNRLSQGERQRVAVCRALLPETPLLLCDEPTGNLDPANKNHVLDFLLSDVARKETTLVIVTHDHELLPRFERVIDFREFTPQMPRNEVDNGGSGP